MATAAMVNVVSNVAVVSCISFRLLAPRYCAISTVPPAHRPTTIFVRIRVTWLPRFTPDMLVVPLKRPTISISATL